jgi:hypothetical protein
MTKYISFHGKQSLKDELLATLARKAREGFFIQGNRDRGPTAAMVGHYSPEEFETRLGLPAWMSPMLESVFDHAQEWSFRGTADSFIRGTKPGQSQEYAHYVVGCYFCMILSPHASQLPKVAHIQKDLGAASDVARVGAGGLRELQNALAHPIGSDAFNEAFEDEFAYRREAVLKMTERAKKIIASHLPTLGEEDAAIADRYLKVAEAVERAYAGGDSNAAHRYAPYDLAVHIDGMKIARYQEMHGNWWDDAARVALFKAVRLEFLY